MFSHMTVGADDTDKAKAFYDATFGALEYSQGLWMTKEGFFIIPIRVFFLV